jgi:hypothetical protein
MTNKMPEDSSGLMLYGYLLERPCKELSGRPILFI